MPEIKHNFTAGKMNKDLDERLIPNGEYRDAMNVQVSTSEGADVGTVQNILGNSKVPEQEFLENLAITCVGSIADEKNDKLYWMLASNTEFNISALLDSDPLDRVRVDIKDMILEYNNTTNEVTPVVIDIYNISIPQSTGFSAAPNPNQPSILNTLINSSGITKGMTLEGYDASGTIVYSATVIDIFGTNIVLSEDILNFFNIEWFVFAKDRVLFFNPSNTITGINIIDEFLMWTDNCYEPKKINIQRSIDGTQYTTTSTRLIAPKSNITLASDILLEESHITVIRKSPKLAPTIEYNTGRDDNLVYTGVVRITDGSTPQISNLDLVHSSQGPISDFSSLSAGDWVIININEDINGNTNPTFAWDVNNNQKVVLKEYDNNQSPPLVPVRDYTIKGVVKDFWDYTHISTVGVPLPNGSITFGNAASGDWEWYKIEITSVNGFPPVPDTSNNQSFLDYAIDIFDETEKLFELKFPRFAYRYRYEDGEYSAFSPFTEVVFEPGTFEYHITKGFNLGMTNNLISLKVKDFITDDMPKDVVAIDLLYKEENSPNIYLVDTIRHHSSTEDNYWANNEYLIDSDAIQNSTLPSNQLLRPWDNVPIKALSQEIVGNRVVYGNYEQNYNLNTENYDNYSPVFKHSLSTVSPSPSDPLKSIKSLREYQLGVVFVDEYGRETPVLSNNTGTFRVNKSDSDTANKLEMRMDGTEFPKEMKYFKFFIKETSGEYYNMAMGRWYDAEDGNIWLTFPSTDRNKIDLDSVLILKKGPNSDELIIDPAKYKVIAIENEAPDYIKTGQYLIEEKTNTEDTVNSTNIGGGLLFKTGIDSGVQPVSNGTKFEMRYPPFKSSSGHALDEITDPLYVEFTLKGSNRVSDRYRVTKIEKDKTYDDDGLMKASKYLVQIDGNFGDIDFLTNTGASGGSAVDPRMAFDAQVRFYKYIVENRPEFDGRFFVKIYNDGIFKEKVIARSVEDADHARISSRHVYLMRRDYNDIGGHQPVTIAGGPAWEGVSRILANSDGINWQNNRDFKPQHFYFFNSENGPWVEKYRKKYNDYWFIDETGYQGKLSGNSNAPQHSNWSNLGSNNWASVEVCYDTKPYGGNPNHGINNSPIKVNNFPHTNQEYGVGIQPDGSNDASQMELSFGPIHGAWNSGEKETGNEHTSNIGITYIWEYEKFYLQSGASKFFSIGDPSGNSYHRDQEDFVKEIVPSTLIRWQKDPSFDVYRINKSVEFKQKVRHTLDHRHFAINNHHSVFPNIPWPTSYTAAKLWWEYTDDWEELKQGNYSKSPYCLYDNWIKSYVTTIEPELKWDPVNHDGTGAIVNGEVIEVTAASVTATSSSGPVPYEYSINLSTVTGTSSVTGLDKDVHVGMALQKYPQSGGVVNVPSKVLVIREISGTVIYLSGWDEQISPGNTVSNTPQITSNIPVLPVAGVYTFVQPAMNGFTETSARAWNEAWGSTTAGHVADIGYELEIVEPSASKAILPPDPAIFETEPKDATKLDLYYEISGYNPIVLEDNDIQSALPVGSTIQHITSGNHTALPNSTEIIGSNENEILLNTSFVSSTVSPIAGGMQVNIDDDFIVTRPDGTSISVNIIGFGTPIASQTYNSVLINPTLYNSTYTSNWHNCYSFGNGVESNRIRDNFNLQYILNGVKASAVLEEGKYEREHRKYGLIYSGLYNSISGVNNLNQFIQAEKITKDINPIYGSIQKLHARDTDLVTLCEDKILRISANKDAIYNADGNPQLIATENVLGQTIPFVGEFGISKNPESFVSEAFRTYFTDKQRGTVMRLSRDGLTPISMHGMKDWFKDNLKLSDKLVGSYDDRNEEYNITLGYPVQKTVSFKEEVKGWTSFKSFVPENAISCANNYFTIFQGILYKHYDENVDRNTFYGNYTDSSVKVVLNESPGSVKSFHTLDYEGSQSRITPLVVYDGEVVVNDQLVLGNELLEDQYYNLTTKDGWYVDSFVTDLENGSLDEFIKKEGKWFNYLRGKSITTSGSYVKDNYDTGSFAVQGIGFADSIECPECGPAPPSWNCDGNFCIDPGNGLGLYSTLLACQAACGPQPAPSWNCYDSNCIDPGDGSGLYTSLTLCQGSCAPTPSVACLPCGDPSADTSVPGCCDNTQQNYDPLATCDDGSCIPIIYGCMDDGTDPNYPGRPAGYVDPNANPVNSALNYYSAVTVDDGSCVYNELPVLINESWNCIDGGCVDPGTGNGTYTSLADCQGLCENYNNPD